MFIPRGSLVYMYIITILEDNLFPLQIENKFLELNLITKGFVPSEGFRKVKNTFHHQMLNGLLVERFVF